MVESIQPNCTYDMDFEGDTDLWQSVLEGDQDAFELLFQKYYDDLYHYAVKFSGSQESAEDHIQKLFLKIWRRRDQLDEVEGVKTYLWTALRRSMIDSFRKRKTEKKYIDKLGHHQGSGKMQFTKEELIIRNEVDSLQSRELKQAIDQLSPKEREVLYLKFYEGMSYEEIEQIMSVNYQTCRNYTYRALQSLKTILSSEVTLGILLIGYLVLLYS